jgi:hypothetical protein
MKLIIRYLKLNFRIFQFFLKEILRNEINTLKATAAFNFMKWMREVTLFTSNDFKTFYCTLHQRIDYIIIILIY